MTDNTTPAPTLFIGGSLDGKCLIIPAERHTVYWSTSVIGDQDMYRRQQLTAGRTMISVFVFQRKTLDEAILDLVNNYKKP